MNKKSVKEIMEGAASISPFLGADYVNDLALSGAVLVTCFGCDVINLFGAIHDSRCAMKEGEVLRISKEGFCEDGANEITCKFESADRNAKPAYVFWKFDTDIPHKEVNILTMYGGELLQAKAILFDINDLK